MLIIQTQGRLGWRGWLLLVAWLAVFVSVAAALTLLALGAALVLLPAFAIASLAAYVVGRLKYGAGRGRTPRRGPQIIEGEYRVLSSDESERDVPPIP